MKYRSGWIIFSLCGGLLFAQGHFNISQPDAVGGSFVATNQDRASMSGGTTAEGIGAGPGIEFFLKYNITPRVFVTGGLGISTITDKIFRMENFRLTLFPLVELKGGYRFDTGSSVQPFLYGGLSLFGFQNKYKVGHDYVTSDRYYDAAPFLGAGVGYVYNEQLTFQITGDYRIILTSTAPVKPKLWVAKAGIVYALKPSQTQRYREEIEYPLGEGEVASLEDLFAPAQPTPSQKPSRKQSEEEALALLFGDLEEEAPSAQPPPTSPTKDQFALAPPTTEQGRFLQETRRLGETVETKSETLKALEMRVSAAEKALEELKNRVISGTYPSVSAGVPLNEATYAQHYQNGLQTFYNRNYTESIRQFQALLASNPNHKLASNCQYWIGECYNQMGRYADALDAFDKVLQYRSSYKFDDALIMSGIVYLRVGNKEAAKQKFQELVKRFPKSEYAPKAMRYLSTL